MCRSRITEEKDFFSRVKCLLFSEVEQSEQEMNGEEREGQVKLRPCHAVVGGVQLGLYIEHDEEAHGGGQEHPGGEQSFLAASRCWNHAIRRKGGRTVSTPRLRGRTRCFIKIPPCFDYTSDDGEKQYWGYGAARSHQFSLETTRCHA